MVCKSEVPVDATPFSPVNPVMATIIRQQKHCKNSAGSSQVCRASLPLTHKQVPP